MDLEILTIILYSATQKSRSLMNKDLKEWAQSQENIKTKKKQKEIKTKPKGMCQICGIKTAKEVCLKCGKFVCNTHYFELVGICEKCMSKKTLNKIKNKKPDWEKELGVDWVD